MRFRRRMLFVEPSPMGSAPLLAAQPRSRPIKKLTTRVSFFIGADYGVSEFLQLITVKTMRSQQSKEPKKGACERRAATMRLDGREPACIRDALARRDAPYRSKTKKQSTHRSECFFWSGLRGSNPPPPPWQGGALPNELNPQVFNLIGDSDGARSRRELRALVAVGSDSPPDCHSLPPLFEQ